MEFLLTPQHCGSLGVLVPAIVALGSWLRRQPPLQHHITAKERRQVAYELFTFLPPVSFVTSNTFHWGEPVLWPCPISKGVGKSNLFLYQEFWQVASVAALNMSCPCPSEPPSSQHTTWLLVFESSVACSSPSLPGARVPRLLPSCLTCFAPVHIFLFPVSGLCPFERFCSHLLPSVQMCPDPGRPWVSSDQSALSPVTSLQVGPCLSSFFRWMPSGRWQPDAGAL